MSELQDFGLDVGQRLLDSGSIVISTFIAVDIVLIGIIGIGLYALRWMWRENQRLTNIIIEQQAKTLATLKNMEKLLDAILGSRNG